MYALLAVLLVASAPSQTGDPLRYLPHNFTVTALTTAPDGSLYAAGALGSDAAILRITDGEVREVYRSAFPSGSTTRLSALAVTANAVYAAGSRNSSPSANAKAFALKLDRTGAVAYLTFLGGSSATWAVGLAVTAAGDAVVSGQTVDDEGARFPATPGTVGATSDANSGFLARLNSAGNVTLAIRGFGLGPVAVDGAGNIFAAGAAYGTADISPTAGAFQRQHPLMGCGGTAMVGFACSYQYVVKISADGTRLLYSTFVTGSYGAAPAALAVTASGDVLLAGTTNSPDYPVTEGVLQPAYRATSPERPIFIGPHPPVYAPAASGYLTRLNATGTVLVWSTYFSGTGTDSIAAMALDSRGRIVVAGQSGSPDLPRAQAAPGGCTPADGQTLPFVAVLDADGKSVLAGRIVYGLDASARPALALAADGTPTLAALDAIRPVQMDAASPLACTTDPADNVRLSRAAPEQLLTLFGDAFGENATVTVDGAPAPVLYRSAHQINFQVPAETAGRDVVTVAVESASGSFARALRIVPRQPAAFLVPGEPGTRANFGSCLGFSFSPAFSALARNQDGSWNECGHPAAPGSEVTYYLGGLGASFDPALLTLRYPDPATIVAVEPDVPGVWKLRVRLTSRASTGTIVPLVDGEPLRSGWLTVWVDRSY